MALLCCSLWLRWMFQYITAPMDVPLYYISHGSSNIVREVIYKWGHPISQVSIPIFFKHRSFICCILEEPELTKSLLWKCFFFKLFRENFKEGFLLVLASQRLHPSFVCHLVSFRHSSSCHVFLKRNNHLKKI